MAKPALVIDMMTSDAADAEEETSPEETPAAETPREDPEALITSIEAQLARLRPLLSGLR